MNVSPFGDLQVAQRHSLIELGSFFPISRRREIVRAFNGGAAATAEGRRVLTTTADANSRIILDSAKRGRYKPGSAGETGIAVFVDQPLTGNQVIRWGYFDDDDGFCYRLDAQGMAIERRSGGVIDAPVRRSEWSGEKLLVETPRDFAFDMADGTVFQIPFTWYGSGPITFQAQIADRDGIQRPVVLHRLRHRGHVSVQNPNLPIRVELDNGGTPAAMTAYVGGRKFEVIGAYDPNDRLTSATRMGVTGIGTTPTPIFAVRRKTGRLGTPIELADLEVIVSGNCVLEAFVDSTLTGATWGGLPGIDAGETALEYAVPTAQSGGYRVFDKSFGLSAVNAKTTPGTDIGRSEEIPAEQTLVLVAYALSGTVDFDLIKMRLREDW